jgi:hypothetical protein
MNNGRTAMLHVVLPPGAGSQTYFSIRVFSFRIDANGQTGGPGEDYTHRWIVGVYVP